MGHFPWLCQIMRGHHWPLEMVTDVWITFERHRFFGINIVLLGKNRSGRVWHTIHHHVRNLAVNGVWLLCYPINPVCESVVRNLGMSTQKSMMFDDFNASDPLHILLNNLQEMMVFWCSLMFIDGFLMFIDVHWWFSDSGGSENPFPRHGKIAMTGPDPRHELMSWWKKCVPKQHGGAKSGNFRLKQPYSYP